MSHSKHFMDQGKDYYAFISYSHKDEEWAKWLQHEFEKYLRHLYGVASTYSLKHEMNTRKLSDIGKVK